LLPLQYRRSPSKHRGHPEELSGRKIWRSPAVRTGPRGSRVLMNPRSYRTKPRHTKRCGDTSRARAARPFRETILIFCEGRETEPNYFHALKRDDEISRK